MKFAILTVNGTYFKPGAENRKCYCKKHRDNSSLLNTERSYVTRLRCSACQSQIPTHDQCSLLIGSIYSGLILARSSFREILEASSASNIPSEPSNQWRQEKNLER